MAQYRNITTVAAVPAVPATSVQYVPGVGEDERGVFRLCVCSMSVAEIKPIKVPACTLHAPGAPGKVTRRAPALCSMFVIFVKIVSITITQTQNNYRRYVSRPWVGPDSSWVNRLINTNQPDSAQ